MKELITYIKAGYSCVQIVTSEEERAVTETSRMAKQGLATSKKPSGYSLWFWSVTTGLHDEFGSMVRIPVKNPGGGDTTQEDVGKKTKDPVDALRAMLEGGIDRHSIVIMNDFHIHLKSPNPMLIRLLKDVIRHFRNTNKHIVIIGCQFNTFPELEKEMLAIELPLPSKEDLRLVAEGIAKSAKIKLNGETDEILDAMAGMTTNEASDAAAFSISKCKKIDPSIISDIKTETIKRNGIVEIVKSDIKISEVGGLDAIKKWLLKRVSGFSKEAKEFGLSFPKGILAIGISGTGKSLIAKTVAGILKVPMLRVDGGKIYGNLVGDSERNMRTALRTADVMAPCVLFVDELEKAMAGMESSGSCDGGTTARVIGTFLQWMQDKTTPVFVVATANDVSKLPPEILRRGRFDQIFFVDLPTKSERADIWKIHISKIKRKPSDYDIDSLAESTEGYTGSEIESIVSDGLFNAFHDKTEPITEIFREAIKETVPLSQTMKERITAMRKWADGRAINASGNKKELNEKSHD